MYGFQYVFPIFLDELHYVTVLPNRGTQSIKPNPLDVVCPVQTT